MGKDTGFKEFPREMPDKRPIEERVADYREFYGERNEEKSREQGGRCMDCGIPFCQQGCPLGNLIPDWNDLVYRDRWKDAWIALRSTNNFPEWTGRLCPAPCEAACTLSINDDPVTIEQIEREIVEKAYREGWVQPLTPRPSTGKSVAIVGSGPAGLAAAEQLRLAGHDVVVYERSDQLGGLLRYGIPDFKMEKHIIDRRLAILRAEGVRFETGIDVGVDIPWTELERRHDAVVVAVGAMKPRDLTVPGRVLEGIHFAMDFLEQQNRRVSKRDWMIKEPISAEGKNVVILGGGDTGSDCLGTSIRQGAKSVTQIELMPQPPEERDANNPWPQWPMVYRTSSSQEEGGERKFALMTTRVSGENGQIDTLHAVEVEPVIDPETGRTRFEHVEGSETEIPCDLLILAMGYTGPLVETLADQLGVETTEWGRFKTTQGFRTTHPKVYVAGDAFRGASLIVWAISDGREVARQIDAVLCEAAPRLPTRGIDQPFGGR